MITVTFQGQTHGEIQKAILGFLAYQPPVVSTSVSLGATVATEVGDPTPTEDPRQMELPIGEAEDYRNVGKLQAEVKSKKKPGRPKAPPMTVNPPGVVAAVKKEASKEAAHNALQQVNIKCGLPTAREILKEFNCQRLSDLKEDQHAGFIDKCNETVKAQG